MHTEQMAIRSILAQVRKAVRGKDQVLARVLLSILARGHILLEDIPGVGKTTMALAFSKALGLRCQRVQFTPEVTPADVVGFTMYDNAAGTAYPLARPLTFSGMGTSIGRFELRLRDAGNGGTDGTGTRLYVAVQNGKAIVRSSRPDITRLEAFGTNGAKTGDESFAGTPEASVAIGRGMSVVRVTLNGGDIRTFKVMH